MAKIAPSILSADFSKLGEETARVTSLGADYLHIDVMDGHFVPNITYGSVVLKALEKEEVAPFDVHLMIEDPDSHMKDFVFEDTEFITVHQETCDHLNRTIDHIHSYGISAGVAINPATPVSTLENVLQDVEMVLVMSVNPGFGGQKFIPMTLDKVKKLAEIRRTMGYDYLIEIDGGVGPDNVSEIVSAGVDVVVAGSAVFGSDDMDETMKRFLEQIR